MGFIAPIMYVVLREKGFELIEIAFLIIVSTITTIILEVPCGVLSDKIGRKILFLLGQSCFLLFCLGMFLTDSLVIMFLAMLLAGLSTAMISGTLDALFVDTINDQNKSPEFLQQSIAKVGLYQMLGLLGGALMSGMFVNNHISWLEVNGFEKNYGIVVLLLPIHMLVTLFLIKEVNRSKPETAHEGLVTMFYNAMSQLSIKPTLKILMISSAVGALAFISFEKFWQIKLMDFLDDEEMRWIFGVLFSASLLISAIGQGLSSSLCRLFKNNYVHVMVLIRILQGSLFILMYIIDELLGFICIFILIFLVSALSNSPVLTLFHYEIKNTERSTMLSFRSVFIQIGATIGILIAALISQYSSLEFAFILSGLVYFGSISMMFFPDIRALGVKLSRQE